MSDIRKLCARVLSDCMVPRPQRSRWWVVARPGRCARCRHLRGVSPRPRAVRPCSRGVPTCWVDREGRWHPVEPWMPTTRLMLTLEGRCRGKLTQEGRLGSGACDHDTAVPRGLGQAGIPGWKVITLLTFVASSEPQSPPPSPPASLSPSPSSWPLPPAPPLLDDVLVQVVSPASEPLWSPRRDLSLAGFARALCRRRRTASAAIRAAAVNATAHMPSKAAASNAARLARTVA